MATAEKPESQANPPPRREVHEDRLTIARLMLLIAGLGIGTPLFLPKFTVNELTDPGFWRMALNAVLVGLALPAPIICMQRALRSGRLGPGGMFALAVGSGVALLLPPAIADWYSRPTSKDTSAMFCLNYSLPLIALWYLLAALVSGHAGRGSFRRDTPWTEKYGFLLALLWSPLGAWLICDIYLGTFAK